MRRSYQKLLEGIRTQRSLLQLAQGGMSAAEFKELIISLFSPFFRNKDSLGEFAVPLLVPDAVVLSGLSTDPWSNGMISQVLAGHRHASVSNESACFMGYGTWQRDIFQGLSHYWSAFELEIDKRGQLPLAEFAQEVARNMAVVIEASLKPLLKELLLMVRIRRAKANPSADLLSMDLGLIVGELIDTCSCPELFAPPPWRIRLNDWRNICQHYNLEVQGVDIVGHYGKPPTRREIRLSRSGFFEVAMKCVQVFEIIKLARTIAIFDNLEKVKPHLPQVVLRPEQEVLALAAALATEGFEVRDVLLDDRSALAVVQDLTDQPPEKRMLHASQFVYQLWTHFPRESITVEFRDRKGNRRLTTAARAVDCEAVAEGRIPFSELATRVVLSRNKRPRGRRTS
jgi:hypothetical protein